MDDHTNRRTALPVGASRRGSCLLSVELNQETKGNHYPTRIGGSSRVTAIKSNRIEDKEQGQASRTGGRPSSSKSVAQKSALAAPKLASSSSSSLRKTRCMQQNSVTSGQWNTTRNVPARLDQVGKDGSAFPKELEPGPSSSCRLGLSEISNLTASEGSNSNFNLLQEAPASSPNRIFFHSNSSVERRESRMLSGTLLDRQGSWNDSDLLNVNGRLPDIAYDDEQQHDWGGIEGNGAVNLRVDPSIRSMAPTHMNDAESQSNIFGTGDHDTTSEDSFFTVASMTEDLYEMDVTTRNDSTLHASPLISQSAQEQGSLRRAMKGHADSPPVSLGEVVNISRPSTFKGKTSTTRTASQGTSKSSSQGILRAGSGSRERHGGRSSVGTSTSRRNIGNFGCTSASDALSSNYSSSNSQDFEKFGNRRPDLVRRVIDGHDSARGRRLAKVSAAGSSGGAVVQRNIRSGVGIASHHPNSKANLPPPRASRTIHAMQPDTWCSQGLLAGDAVMESETSRESSSSSMRMADQTSLLGNRLGGSSPPSVRGRSAIGTLQRRNNISFGAACAFGEGMANRFVGSTSRSASSGHFGSAGSVAPPRPPPGPSVAVSSRPHASAGAPVSLSFSGHVPPRAPPTALSSPISASFLSAVDTSSSNLFDGSVFGRSTSGNDGPPERSVPGHSEGVGRRAFRSFSIESETQSRYTMEGLAEVLLALEQIEQDEELTYEQVLMFEANLLFGGINIHDQHSDMRLDIDNMSYEELLALEERMGNVSTGLAEDVILKCLTRVRYSSVAAASSNSQESELKCSVCQEEYEERDELGRLRCDHSYHAVCIRQWLLQKNQCPICKAPASL